jgi:hypothetical protein
LKFVLTNAQTQLNDTVVSKIEAELSHNLESVVVESVINNLRPFSFDPIVNRVVSELSTWVSENRAELVIFNTINALSKIPNQYYSDICEKLGTCLVEGKTSSDYLSMILTESTELPAN